MVGCMPNGREYRVSILRSVRPKLKTAWRNVCSESRGPYNDGMGILENARGADSGESKLIWGSQEPRKKKKKKQKRGKKEEKKKGHPHIFQITSPRHFRPCAIRNRRISFSGTSNCRIVCSISYVLRLGNPPHEPFFLTLSPTKMAHGLFFCGSFRLIIPGPSAPGIFGIWFSYINESLEMC